MTKGFILLILFLSLAFISPVSAEKADYIYDNLGRVIKAVSETGDAAVYTYDEVGNLISITGGVTQPQPPQLYSISPNVIFVGNTVTITIQGKNLIATEEITSDNPGMIIESFSSTDTTITVNANISSTSATGLTNITVKTAFGNAGIPLTLLRLTFNPDVFGITQGTSKDVTATLEGNSSDFTVMLNNYNPDIIQCPQSITISAGGSSVFAVNALMEGTGVITAENVGLSVYVTSPLSGAMTASTQPVSVLIDKSLSGGNISSLPVSVKMGFVNGGITVSNLVSVKMGFTSAGTTMSNLVSVKIGRVNNGTVVSSLVSVTINKN